LGRQSRLSAQGWTPGQRLDEAEATLAQLTAAIERVSAQIAGIDIDLSKSELKAPFDGRIAARSIHEGAVVAAGTPVAMLLESGRQQARIGLPPEIARDLDAGAARTLRIGETTLRAAIASRRPDLDTATRTMTVLFDVVDPPQNVMFGDLVTLEIGTRVEERGAWLPLAALKEGQRGLWSVLVADASAEVAIVRPEAVEVLHVEGSRVFVRGALRDGDHILSRGADRVVAGQRVALARN
jgi:membrane fusion protein, multidrug efflux system